LAIKKYFFAGCVVFLPFFVTVYIIAMFLFFIDNAGGRLINSFLIRNYGFGIPGVGLILMLGLILAIGVFSSRFFGKRFVPWVENILLRIPFFKTIYLPSKQLAEYMFGTGRQKVFKKVVFVPFSEGSFTLGFITNENLLEFNGPSPFISVFIPFAPTPFSGIMLFYSKEKIRFLDVTIDQALKCIISGGIISPFQKS